MKGLVAMLKLNNDWDEVLKEEIQQEYYLKMRKYLAQEYRNHTIYPLKDDVFNAFRYCGYNGTRVVILGQDPYINPGEAHGLSFSVQKGVRIPPSLRNIYQEAADDAGISIPVHGDLTHWAKQGVLLLNAVLTVRGRQSSSHKGIGWETFTDHVICFLDKKEDPVVFLLWGNFAKKKAALIAGRHHKILTAVHPSPLAGNGFSGCKHFSQTNEFLKTQGYEPIDWQIPDQ